MGEDKRNTLLIVDDEHVNVKILTNILGKEYALHIANDGVSALEKAKEILPDLILLDIVMPGIDGYEVLDKLKNNEKTKDIPVIYISGLNHIEEEEKGLAHGAVDYISKPFSAMIIKLRVGHQIKIINQTRTIKQLGSANVPKTEQFS